MLLLRFLELIAPFALALFLIWEIVVPILTGRPMFPILRNKSEIPKLQSELDTIHQQMDVENLTDAVSEAKEEVKSVRRKRSSQKSN